MATATRLFVPQDLSDGALIEATPDQAHYLGRVLRLQAGAALVLFNGRHGEWQAELQAISKTRAEFRLLHQMRGQSASPDLWLAFAPVKKTQTDFIIQKATEIGVSRLLPVMTARTQSERVKVERLTAIAIEASEQCERLDVPVIEAPQPLERLIETWPNDRSLYVCAEAGQAVPLAEAVRARDSGSVGFVTGPEGGFSAAELDFMRSSPLVLPVSLGPRILRAETAALMALAVWQAIAGDGASRPPPRG